MRQKIRIAGEDIHLMMTFQVFAAGLAGGLAARVIGVPLPMLLGSVVAVGALSVFGYRPGGQPPKVPVWLRMFFIPIIGLSIGSAITPDVLREARAWWPSLLALVLFIPIAHFMGYKVLRRVGRLSPVTAYYSAVPGGFIECIAMGEEAGANVPMLTALQFLRLILTVMLVPLAFTLLSGAAVGSAAGVEMAPPGGVLDAPEIFWQVVIGAIGFFAGRRLKFPAYMITGPILASGLAHLTGLLQAAPPRQLIDVTQLVIGVALGTRFVGMAVGTVVRAMGLATLNIALTMVLAIALGLLLHQVVGEQVEAVVLAFAPGGLAEMSLVALSLHVSALYVTAHHILRIMLAVTFAKMFAHLIVPRD